MVAARRKKPVAPAAVDAGAFVVVLESLRGDFKVFGEALADVKAEVHDVRVEVHNLRAETQAGFERVDRELAGVKHEIAGMKHEIADVKHEIADVKVELADVKVDLAGVKVDLAGVKVDLGLVKSAVLEHGRELREIRDRKVGRDEVEGIVQGVLARAGGG
jgi:chromosome segregation ATPase